MAQHKRTDWEVGAWYYNPMMETSGTTKARYVRIWRFDSNRFDSCTSFVFDQHIMPDGSIGYHQLTQSNKKYEADMVKLSGTSLESIIVKLKLAAKRKRYGL